MIIKGLRVRTKYGVERLIRHVKNAEDNEAVRFLRGTEADVRDMLADARQRKATYSIRHWIVAPHQPITAAQALETVDLLASEFGFDPLQSVVVEHKKPRAVSTAADVHWHLLVPERDPVSSKALKTSHDWIRHELIARISECRFGHGFTCGKHNAAVVKGMKQRGLHEAATQFEEFCREQTQSYAAFSHDQFQRAKRLGHDLPRLTQSVKSIVAAATNGEAMIAELAALGLQVSAGDKPGTWLVRTSQGALVGALHRLGRRRHADIAALMGQRNDPSTMPSVPDVSQASTDKQAAMDAIEDIASNLEAIEKDAREQLEVLPPESRLDDVFNQAAAEVHRSSKRFSDATQQRMLLRIQLATIPESRWWHFFLGLAGAREKSREKAAREVLQAEAGVTEAELALSRAQRKLSRIELKQKNDYAARLKAWSEGQREAKTKLAMVERARSLIDESPDICRFGLQYVIRRAASDPADEVASWNSAGPRTASAGSSRKK